MTRKPTMKDVAGLARVAPMTVSRLLTGSARVSEEASARIFRAIEKLGYRPNELARALRGRKSNVIGIIVPYLYDPFFAMCAQAVNTTAREHGYSVILSTSNEDTEAELAEAQWMLRRYVDGLVVIPASRGRSRLNTPEFESTHMVAMDRPFRAGGCCSVVVENRAGTEQAIQHLISVHGHKRIAFAALNDSLFTFRTRLEGYERAMRSAGLAPLPMIACPTQKEASTALLAALRGPHAPTAIFTANGLTTHYTLKTLIDAGLRVPADIAIAAFDDFEMADTLEPRVSVVRQPAQQLGRTAANLLFQLLLGEKASLRANKVVLPVEWVPRNSCGCNSTMAHSLHNP